MKKKINFGEETASESAEKARILKYEQEKEAAAEEHAYRVRRAIKDATPETRELVAVMMGEVAANLRERHKDPDYYYGDAASNRADEAFNALLEAVENALDVEAQKLVTP